MNYQTWTLKNLPNCHMVHTETHLSQWYARKEPDYHDDYSPNGILVSEFVSWLLKSKTIKFWILNKWTKERSAT